MFGGVILRNLCWNWALCFEKVMVTMKMKEPRNNPYVEPECKKVTYNKIELVLTKRPGRDLKFTVVWGGIGCGLRLWKLTLISILNSKLWVFHLCNSLRLRLPEIGVVDFYFGVAKKWNLGSSRVRVIIALLVIERYRLHWRTIVEDWSELGEIFKKCLSEESRPRLREDAREQLRLETIMLGLTRRMKIQL